MREGGGGMKCLTIEMNNKEIRDAYDGTPVVDGVYNEKHFFPYLIPDDVTHVLLVQDGVFEGVMTGGPVEMLPGLGRVYRVLYPQVTTESETTDDVGQGGEASL